MAYKMNDKLFDAQVQRAVQEVESLCVPELMPKEQAKDFLEEVIGRLEGAVEAIEEEIAEETGNDNE